MSKPILYGVEPSPPVRAVRAAAAAIGLELDWKLVDLAKGEHLQEWFLKLNPQHTVPTLDDNGNVFWDSHAICTYLVSKYAATDALYPKDLVQRARVDQRLHFDSGVLFASFRTAYYTVKHGGATEIAEDKLNAWRDGLQLLETFLQNDQYLVGNTLTLADICCVTTVATGLAVLPVDGKDYPKVLAWVQRLFQLRYIDELNTKINQDFRVRYDKMVEANRLAKK